MPSPIRLNKVLKELNISLDRAIEFLSSKNIEAYVEVLTPIFKLDKGKATNKSKLKREIADTVRLNMEKKIQM